MCLSGVKGYLCYLVKIDAVPGAGFWFLFSPAGVSVVQPYHWCQASSLLIILTGGCKCSSPRVVSVREGRPESPAAGGSSNIGRYDLGREFGWKYLRQVYKGFVWDEAKLTFSLRSGTLMFACQAFIFGDQSRIIQSLFKLLEPIDHVFIIQ